jgi:hypothetical protein
MCVKFNSQDCRCPPIQISLSAFAAQLPPDSAPPEARDEEDENLNQN